MSSEAPAEAAFLTLVNALPGKAKPTKTIPLPAVKRGAANWSAHFAYGPDDRVESMLVAPDDGVGSSVLITPIRDDFGRIVTAQIEKLPGGAQ